MKTTLDFSNQSVHEQLIILHPLLDNLKKNYSVDEKITFLNDHVEMDRSLIDNLLSLADPTSQEERRLFELVIKSVIAIGQGGNVFASSNNQLKMKHLLTLLVELEHFYQDIGGIVGYHIRVLELMDEKNSPRNHSDEEFTKPYGLDISKSKETADATLNGLKHFPSMGMMFPIGGAGDRLGLADERTGEALPAGLLMFCGNTLIEGLMRDLQAKEYLYYKLFQKQLLTPVALMTSREKNNHEHVLEVFEKNQWFGRPHESFFFFDQPLVPLVTPEGNWVMKDHLEMALKPGGHGVMWKLARDRGVFEWFQSCNRDRVLIRQINNPMAGIDNGLLAFLGKGCGEGKSFGFLSCPRQIRSAEGVLVTVKRKNASGFDYRISNIEYTSFPLYGIEDVSGDEEEYSIYPSNTNILFADLNKIQEALNECSIPGMLVNVKTGVNAKQANGEVREVQAGRLESTMQNISDQLVTISEVQLSKSEQEKKLQVFVVYNDRVKTISVTKNSYVPGKPVQETPEGAFYDYLLNASDLLSNYCKVKTPFLGSREDYLARGPDFIFIYHPALGPLYQVISKKIKGGILHKGSELQLEIAEIDLENIEIDGSLLIEAKEVMGSNKCFNQLNGKCTLKNVRIINKGREKRPDQIFWKNQLLRHEKLKITLHGNAEFHAENLSITGNQEIEVQSGYRMVAKQVDVEVVYHLEKIDAPTWEWKYSISNQNEIQLFRDELQKMLTPSN